MESPRHGGCTAPPPAPHHSDGLSQSCASPPREISPEGWRRDCLSLKFVSSWKRSWMQPVGFVELVWASKLHIPYHDASWFALHESTSSHRSYKTYKACTSQMDPNGSQNPNLLTTPIWTASNLMALPVHFPPQPPVKHLISLGCRCSQASVYRLLGQRRYAGPFDWVFSSPQVVIHCLQDDFNSFLDRSQLYQNGSSFDAIGLKPGSAPRERKLIGHKVYSSLTAGVGRGTIFNHRDPLHNEEDYLYTCRSVERFRLALASSERKVFVMWLGDTNWT